MIHPPNPLTLQCSDFRKRLQRLKKRGAVSPAIERIVTLWVARLEHSGELYASYPLRIQRDRAPRIRKSYLQLEALVRRIEGKDSVDSGDIASVFSEAAARILGANVGTELVVVMSPVEKTSLESTFDLDANRLTFILFLSPTFDYTSHPLLPRVVHEVAHAEPSISALLEEQWSYPRKLGELCCDLVATLVAGPVYLFSTKSVVQAMALEDAQKATASHPCFACRISVLQTVASEIWTSATLTTVVSEALSPVSSITCTQEDDEVLERLRGDTVGLIPNFGHMAVGEGIWEGIYSGSNSVRQGSILANLNIEVTGTRVAR